MNDKEGINILPVVGGNEKAVSRTEVFHAIYKLALDKLKDLDGVFNIRSYFNL